MRLSCYLSLDGNGPFEDSMHSQDCTLRWIDDGCAQQRSEYSTVRDGEGASVHILDGERALLGLVGQPGDGQLDVGKVHALYVP